MEKASKSRIRTTKKQLEFLVAFIEQNIILAETCNTKTSNVEGEVVKELWAELGRELNSLEGPQRSIKEWKQVFADLKTNTRRRLRQKKMDICGTGGGPAKEKPLSPLEERVELLIKKVVIEGIPNVGEAGLEQKFDDGMYQNGGLDVAMHVDEHLPEQKDIRKSAAVSPSLSDHIQAWPKSQESMATFIKRIKKSSTAMSSSSTDYIQALPRTQQNLATLKKKKSTNAALLSADHVQALTTSQEHLATAIDNLSYAIVYLGDKFSPPIHE